MENTVKTFNNDKLVKLLNDADPYLIEYIEAIERVLSMQKGVTDKAIKKIKELQEKNDLLTRAN